MCVSRSIGPDVNAQKRMLIGSGAVQCVARKVRVRGMSAWCECRVFGFLHVVWRSGFCVWHGASAWCSGFCMWCGVRVSECGMVRVHGVWVSECGVVFGFLSVARCLRSQSFINQ